MSPVGYPLKYRALQTFLASTPESEVTLTFPQVEEIIGAPLPRTATQRQWWANRWEQSQARAWLGAGWQTRMVQVRDRRVTFRRGGIRLRGAAQPAKYAPLECYLKAASSEAVTLKFAAIAALIEGPLPPSAGRRGWWSNQSGMPQTRAWLGAGWRVSQVAPHQEWVTFVRQPLVASV